MKKRRGKRLERFGRGIKKLVAGLDEPATSEGNDIIVCYKRYGERNRWIRTMYLLDMNGGSVVVDGGLDELGLPGGEVQADRKDPTPDALTERQFGIRDDLAGNLLKGIGSNGVVTGVGGSKERDRPMEQIADNGNLHRLRIIKQFVHLFIYHFLIYCADLSQFTIRADSVEPVVIRNDETYELAVGGLDSEELDVFGI